MWKNKPSKKPSKQAESGALQKALLFIEVEFLTIVF
jgi:hypothetical protein